MQLTAHEQVNFSQTPLHLSLSSSGTGQSESLLHPSISASQSGLIVLMHVQSTHLAFFLVELFEPFWQS